MRAVPLAILGLVFSACATPDWRMTVVTGDFHVFTTEPWPESLESVHRLERTYDGLRELFEARRRPARPIPVEINLTHGAIADPAGKLMEVEGKAYVRHSPGGDIKFLRFENVFGSQVLRHELTHIVLLLEFPATSMMPWLQEGLAFWIQYGAEDPDTGRVSPPAAIPCRTTPHLKSQPAGSIFDVWHGEFHGERQFEYYRYAAAIVSHYMAGSEGSFREKLERLIAMPVEDLKRLEQAALATIPN